MVSEQYILSSQECLRKAMMGAIMMAFAAFVTTYCFTSRFFFVPTLKMLFIVMRIALGWTQRMMMLLLLSCISF